MAYSRQRLAWLAAWLQRRRRLRASRSSEPPVVIPNAPVFTDSGFEWDQTQADWADTFFDWTFDHGSFPVASIEIWLARDNNGSVYELVTTVPSTTGSYRHACATKDEDYLHYKLRYVDGGTGGPFSSELEVNVQR
jgi:hypothetical protein